MKTKGKITGIGYCGMDYLCLVPRIPIDDKVEIIQSLVQGGGPAVTAITAAARLGAETAFIGSVGDDERGKSIIDELSAEGIDVRSIKVRKGAESPAAYCWIEKKSGKRSIAWARGNAKTLSPDEIDTSLIKNSKVLHLDGHQTRAAIAMAKIARKSGVTVSIDAGTIVPGIDQLLGLSDIIIASEKFARLYTGKSGVEAAVKKLFAANCRFSAVTMGSRGSIGFDGRRIIRCPSFKVDVVDTTGAGDVFHGAFVYQYSRGRAWPECMRFASAVSALKCTRFGGRTGIPDLKTTEKFLERK
ncbi:MAG: PfkB family carbohydrate kinase [Kiritimatiellae bacterium]|nr:PfkB family carbohydrate kinase [Kiritimatiellia bacterium]MDD5519671.1 PfkB family carbohydrate kinase [Kiritimatiellia bacterium]